MDIHHVESLNSIEKLKKLGFVGGDTSLEECLFEYGIAWKDLGEETLFVYKVSGEGEESRFDRQAIANPNDITKEFDWVDWTAFMSFVGEEFNDWIERPIGQKVSDLKNYYGIENVFGSCYWEGFSVER